MIQAHQVKDGRVEIGDVALIFDGPEAEFVGRPHGLAAFHARSCKPHAEPMPVVIAAGFTHAFAGWRAPEFAAPDEQCFVPESSAFEVRHERGDGLVGFARVQSVIANAVVVAIPGVFDVPAA